MLKISKLYQCIRIVLCYQFTFIIQIVIPLFRWFLRFPWILTFSVTEVAKCSGLNQTVAHSYKRFVRIPMVSNFGLLNRLQARTKLASGAFHSSRLFQLSSPVCSSPLSRAPSGASRDYETVYHSSSCSIMATNADSTTKCFHWDSTQSISWYSAEVSAFIFIGFRRTHIGEYIRDDIDH